MRELKICTGNCIIVFTFCRDSRLEHTRAIAFAKLKKKKIVLFDPPGRNKTGANRFNNRRSGNIVKKKKQYRNRFNAKY